MNFRYLYGKLVKKLHGKCIKETVLDGTARVGTSCNIQYCKIGKYSYISHDSQIVNTEIGAFCSISDHVYIGGPEHPYFWVSTSPVFENVKGCLIKERLAMHPIPSPRQTIIGNDVWIGHNVIVKAGVSIGDGVVIGAGSVVTKNVPPYTIVVGVPARVISYRFDEETISGLLKTEWWTLSDDEIQQVAEYIKTPKLFLEKVNKMLNINKMGGGK